MASSDDPFGQHFAGDRFSLTLPSNVSQSFYKKNSNGHYFTRLQHPIKLPRGDWVVGISDIHFTKSWHNVEAGTVTWLEEQLTDPTSLEPDDRLAASRPDYTLQPGEKLYLRKRLQMNAGLYDSLADVLESLRRLFDGTLLKEAVRFYHRQNADRVYLSLYSDKSKGRVRELTFSEDLCQILGFPVGTWINEPGYYGTMSPDINRGMTGLYVYSNVVDNRLVGDAYVPLLRVIPLASRFAEKYENVYVEFNNIQYHDVANFQGRDIEIRIARDNGDTVNFDKGKVIIALHFKRIYKR
jgi:hypothetical protein